MAASEKAAVQQKEVHMAELTPLMDEILRGGGTVELTVTGNSMRPMLCHGVSRVRLVRADTLRRGDIPLYRREKSGRFVLHRIVEVENGCYTCCGDAQWHLERGIRPEQVLGVVTAFARKDAWTACESAPYRAYWKVWLKLRPLRRLVFGGWGCVKRMLRGMVRK